MLKNQKEKVQSEETAPFLIQLYNYLIYIKILSWLPLVDALRNQFVGPSKELMDTILIAQNQVKDGFLVAGQF